MARGSCGARFGCARLHSGTRVLRQPREAGRAAPPSCPNPPPSERVSPQCLGFPVSRGELVYRRRTGGRRPESRCLSASLRIANADLLLRVEKSASRVTPGIWAKREPPARRGTHRETRDTGNPRHRGQGPQLRSSWEAAGEALKTSSAPPSRFRALPSPCRPRDCCSPAASTGSTAGSSTTSTASRGPACAASRS